MSGYAPTLDDNPSPTIIVRRKKRNGRKKSFCPVAGKRMTRYTDEYEAGQTAKFAARRGASPATPIWCEPCNCAHLLPFRKEMCQSARKYKIRYQTEQEALIASVELRERGLGRFRLYECPSCPQGVWHLTSIRGEG